jgi:hypothetical protein
MILVWIREQIEADLQEILEGSFSLPIVLFGPDGERQDLNGQVVYETIEIDPQSGSEVIVEKPVVTVRRSSLSRVPLFGEPWSVQIPGTPSRTATMVTYMLERPPEGGRSIGFIRLYLMKAAQV